MDLKDFVIPVSGLKTGVHHFDFQVDWQFFAHFEESPVKQGRFEVLVDLDKQYDHWIVDFQVSGSFDTECDRCTAPIALPVEGAHRIYVRYEEDELAEEPEEEVIYVEQELHTWDVSQFVYEFILLSVPTRYVYACEEEQNPPCDLGALELLNGEQSDSEQGTNPFREAFKDIDIE